MKDKDEYEAKNGKLDSLNEDDDYNFTEDQRQAALELQSLYRELGLEDFEDGLEGGFSVYEEPDVDIKEKLKEVNAQFNEDETPLESDRVRKVHFKDLIVDLVVPISPLRDKSVDATYYDFEDLESSSEDEENEIASDEETRDVTNSKEFLTLTGSGAKQQRTNDDTQENAQQLDEAYASSDQEVYTDKKNPTNVPTQNELQELPIQKYSRKSKTKAMNKSTSNVGCCKMSNGKTVEPKEKFIPTYKGNARSPYGIPEEIKKELKRVRQVEAQQKKINDMTTKEFKQKRKEEAERAYRAWLEIKKSQIRRSDFPSPPRKQNPLTPINTVAVTKEEDTENALRVWLEHKAYQENKERIMRHLVQQEKSMMLQRFKREDSKRAYKAWLKKKKGEHQQVQIVQQQRSRQQVEVLSRTFHAYFGSTLQAKRENFSRK